jgi:hypothetical protein
MAALVYKNAASFSNISADSAAFNLEAGNYGVTITATFGGGTVTLQRLAADATTYVTCLTAFTAAGYATVLLPSGTYKFDVVTATGVYVDITSIAEGS